MTSMAEHQHTHTHYHHIADKPDVPFWQVCVLYIIGLGALALVGVVLSGNLMPVLEFALRVIVLPGALIAAAVYGFRYIVDHLKAKADHRRKLAADADAQHNKVMSGDPAGFYGNYPPAC